MRPRPAGGIAGGIDGGIDGGIAGRIPEEIGARIRDRGVVTSLTSVRRADGAIGRSILALVTHGRAGATARQAACELAESADGWLTLAVPVEQPAWLVAFAALGGHAVHPAELDRMARVELQEQLDAVPPHVKTHGLLLRGPLGAALLARVSTGGHDLIVVPACPRLLPLRAWLRVRSSVPVCVSSSQVRVHPHLERRKQC
jgi:hypothetical protein